MLYRGPLGAIGSANINSIHNVIFPEPNPIKILPKRLSKFFFGSEISLSHTSYSKSSKGTFGPMRCLQSARKCEGWRDRPMSENFMIFTKNQDRKNPQIRDSYRRLTRRYDTVKIWFPAGNDISGTDLKQNSEMISVLRLFRSRTRPGTSKEYEQRNSEFDPTSINVFSMFFPKGF